MPWGFLIPLALSAAGAAVSYSGQKKAANAQAAVLNDYRARNKAREAQAQARFQESLSKSGTETAADEMDKGAARRQEAYDAARQQMPTQPLPMAPKGNTLVKGAPVKNAGTAWSRLMDRAQSKLGSYQDWQLGQGIKNVRANQDLARITSDAKSDLDNVVPVEMAGAARKGDALQGWGSLLQMAGSLMGMNTALGGAASKGSVSGWGLAPGAKSPLAKAVPGMTQGGGMWSGLMAGL